jgi:hypothetical protein
LQPLEPRWGGFLRPGEVVTNEYFQNDTGIYYTLENLAGIPHVLNIQINDNITFGIEVRGQDNTLYHIDGVGGYPGNFNFTPFTLPTNDQYRLSITRQYGEATDIYARFTLRLGSVSETTLILNQPVEGELMQDEMLDIYRFSAEPGSDVVVLLQHVSYDAQLTLEDPTMSTLLLDLSILPYSENQGANLVQIQSAGEYILSIGRLSESSGRYRLWIFSQTPRTISPGDTLDMTFSLEQPLAMFDFTSSEGEFFTLAVEGDSGLDTVLTIVDTNGLSRFDDDSGSGLDPELYSFQSTYPGRLVAIVMPYYTDATGTARLTLARTGLLNLTIGSTAEAFLSPKNPIITLSLDVQAGVTYRLRAIYDTFATLETRILVAQNLETVTTLNVNNSPSASVEFIAPADGEMVITITNLSQIETGVQFQLEQLE